MADRRPDSKTVLQHGTGTPYLAIFNPQKSAIRDPRDGQPIGTFVTDFQYVYEEEKTDHGQIVIDTDNPNLVAHNELGYHCGLYLQWGYIYGDGTNYIGPMRRVLITGIKAGFTATGVHITIEFSDASVLLKNTSSTYYDNTKGFINYVEDLCKGVPIGIALVDYTEKAELRPKVAQRVVDNGTLSKQFPNAHNTDTRAEWATGSPLNVLDPHEVSQPPSVDVPHMVGVELMDWNPVTQKLTINDPDNFRKVYLNDPGFAAAMIVATSRNKYYQLADVARSVSGGPYFVDSRDDKIIIHNAENKRDITKVYTYAGGYGELIEFTVNSKFTKAAVEVKQSNDLDPDTKGLDTTLVQGVIDPDSGNPDGVDMYMVWPDQGTMFWNPQGGSVNPNPASRAPLFGQKRTPTQGKPGSMVEYHQQSSPKANTVAAQQERPQPQRSYYSNVNEAKQWFTEHPGVSQQEIESWFTQWQAEFEAGRKATGPESLAEVTHKLDRIPPFRIKRKVSIVAEVNLERLGGSRGLKNQAITESQTEAFRNAILSGQVDLSSYGGDTYSLTQQSGKGGYTGDNSMIMRGTYIRNAEAMLQQGGFQVIEVSRREGETDAQYRHRRAENRIVSIETEIELDLNGVDIAAGADTLNIPGSLGNDISDRVTHSVTAEATVIGDPCIESSMNIQIQNVSDKYSGIWYTKKVTHTIGKDGYLTKIEFVQRTLPFSQVTIKSTLSKKDYAQQVLSAFKQAKESGSYKIPSTLERDVKNKLREAPERSVISQVDPKTGEVRDHYRDMVSGNYVTDPMNNKTYYRDNFSPYIQELQKDVKQLPR